MEFPLGVEKQVNKTPSLPVVGITLFFVFPRVVSLCSSKQTAEYAGYPSTDGGREAAAGGYGLNLTLTADSVLHWA